MRLREGMCWPETLRCHLQAQVSLPCEPCVLACLAWRSWSWLRVAATSSECEDHLQPQNLVTGVIKDPAQTPQQGDHAQRSKKPRLLVHKGQSPPLYECGHVRTVLAHVPCVTCRLDRNQGQTHPGPTVLPAPSLLSAEPASP